MADRLKKIAASAFLFTGGVFFGFAIYTQAEALSCNDPSGFLKSFGPMITGDVLVLGPDCQHVSDGGVPGTGTVSGPVSSIIGNLAFWTNTVGTTLGASPAYLPANPANSALYSVMSNPPGGYTGIYNALQINQGLQLSGAFQYLGGSVPVQQAVVGAVVTSGTDADTWQAAGVAGYALAESAPAAGSGRNMVGVFGQAAATVGPANLFGGNFLATNDAGSGSGPGFDLNYMSGIEIDLNIFKKAGGADPTINGGHAYGITIAGGGTLAASPTGSAAILVNMLSVGATQVPWNYGWQTLDGAATIGILFGATSTANNSNSQPIRFGSKTAGGLARTSDIHGDPNGAVIIAPDSNSGVVAHLTGIGGSTEWQSCASCGSLHMNIPSATTPGVAVNDAGGNINTTPILPVGQGGTGVSTGAILKVNPRLFTASGTYTPSAGLLYAQIECTGAGGGGGSAAGTAGNFTTGSGGGGGAGARRTVSAATIGASQTVTIGAAGTGGAAAAGGNNGTAGGQTSVGTLCVASGGGGGPFGKAAVQVQQGGLGGLTGTGDILAQGGDGGGGLGAASAIGLFSGFGGSGGGVMGGGTTTVPGPTQAGSAGHQCGGGGSGGQDASGTQNFAGGNGNPGCVLITEFLSQ